MVVVGKAGRSRRAICTAWRRPNGEARLAISGVTAARRAATAASWILGEARRAAAAAVEAVSSAVTASRPSLRARARMASSAIFCTAKASQVFTSVSMTVSASRSMGVCSSEQEGASTIARRSFSRGSSRSGCFQVGAPDVAAVDDAERQDQAGRAPSPSPAP
jgi:hypothetical protein